MVLSDSLAPAAPVADAVDPAAAGDAAHSRMHAGRVVVCINAKAGTARTADQGVLKDLLEKAVAEIGELVEVRFLEPKAWTLTLKTLAASDDIDTVVVGGGDGSISSAGTIFVGTGKTMGVIPLGTFNLFARSLRIPPGLEASIAALPSCVAAEVDVGVLHDGQGREHLFLHHVSIGFHPRFIATRDAMPYASRLGKMMASLRVWLRSMRSLKRLTLTIHGDVERPRGHYYQAAVTVGSFREGHIDFPHAEDLTQGDLDLVLMPARGRWHFVAAMLQAGLGRWRSNARLEVDAVRAITIESGRPRMTVSIDGELVRAEPPFAFEVRPQALRVLRPA